MRGERENEIEGWKEKNVRQCVFLCVWTGDVSQQACLVEEGHHMDAASVWVRADRVRVRGKKADGCLTCSAVQPESVHRHVLTCSRKQNHFLHF